MFDTFAIYHTLAFTVICYFAMAAAALFADKDALLLRAQDATLMLFSLPLCQFITLLIATILMAIMSAIRHDVATLPPFSSFTLFYYICVPSMPRFCRLMLISLFMLLSDDYAAFMPMIC